MKKNKKVPLSKKPFLVLSRRAIAGWLGVIFILCAWMFIIGLLVGRGTAPVNFEIDGLQTKLEFSRPGFLGEPKALDRGEPGTVKDKTKLDFYEALPEDRDDTKIDQKKPPRAALKKADPAPAEKASKTTGQGAQKKSITQKASSEAAGSAKKAPKKPVASKSADRQQSSKTYTVQVAALKAAQDADRLVAQLKKKGHPAYRIISKVQGKGIWFRVRVGRYKSKAEALAMKQKLVKAGMKPIVVVQ